MKDPLAAKIREIAAERSSLISCVPSFEGGLEWCHAHTELCDRVVRMIFKEAVADLPDLPTVALIATGGYGRRELAPFSDIDITLVPLEDSSSDLDPLIRRLYQDIHHAFQTVMRLDVGWAFRLAADAPGLDARTRTGLLDARLVAGSPEVLRTLEDALWESFPVGDFILAKVEEREKMWAKHHDTPLVTEPHLKEGAGGLRSFHAANWIAVAIGERPAKPTPSYDHVLRVRNLLHVASSKVNDQLTRSRQADIAERLGTRPNDFMRPLTEAMVDLQREYDLRQERLKESRYSLAKGVFAMRGEAHVTPNADAGEAAVGIAIATKLGLRVPETDVATGPEIAGPAALYAVSTGESTLRNLDRCGLLERLLPDLTACRTLLSDDSVHTFTVFEHTLRVVRNLDQLVQGSFLWELKQGLRDPSLLYLAVLLHDVGKLDSSRLHSEAGAEMAERAAKAWGLSARDTEPVVWLVREHLSMERFIRIRDVHNPATVAEFAKIVGDPDRLAALTVLTWADVTAVAPGTWTTAQDAFLKELYIRALDVLQGEAVQAPDSGVYRQRLMRQLRDEKSEDQPIAQFVESLPAHYLTSATPEVARLHFRYFNEALENRPTIEFNTNTEVSATEVTVCALDAPGLLNRMLGVFYALDITMDGIRASTTRTEKPVALDVFTVSMSGKPVPAATCRQISASMMAVLKGQQSVESLLMERGKDPFMQQRVFSHAYIEGNPGVLEVRAARGRGMAYRLSRFISERGWNIVAARVGQWAGSSAAAFYILDEDEQPIPKASMEAALGERLRAN